MSLYNAYIRYGNIYFRYRTYMPLLFIVPIIIYIYIYPKSINIEYNINWIIFCFFISMIGELIRILTIGYTPKGTSGRNTKTQKARKLNILGIYSIVRHPLYLGNYIIWLGLISLLNNYIFILFFTFIFYFYYEKIIFAEEKYLLNIYKNKYLEWSMSTPAIIPNIFIFKVNKENISFKRILVREYNTIVSINIIYCLISIIEYKYTYNMYGISYPCLFILIISILFFFYARMIKK